jgi:signal transduction histidine kinase
MKNRIAYKLTGVFGIFMLLMLTLVWFNVGTLRRLERLNQKTLQLFADMEAATDAEHVGQDLYMVIVNVLVNREFGTRDQTWAASKRESLVRVQKVSKAAADTPEEKRNVREAQDAVNDLIGIYEQEMLPIIRKDPGITRKLIDLDARIDQKISVIDLAMKKVSESMASDSRKGAAEFRAELAESIRIGFGMVLLVVLAAVLVVLYTIRRFVNPVTELTRMALDMEKGDYPVGLSHSSTDELGLLANAFRGMAVQVEKRTTELVDSNCRLLDEISERKHAEEKIRQLNAELERRVTERTAELTEAVANLRVSQEQLRNLSTHQKTMRENERKTVAREIHDELGQLLAVLKLDVSWLNRKIPAQHKGLIEKTTSMKDHIDMTIKSVQRIATDLRPTLLDHLGLPSAIESYANQFCERTGIACELDIDAEMENVDLERSTDLFRIVQEALTNTIRHANASHVLVRLYRECNRILLEINDNGRGIPTGVLEDPRSVGLTGMRERAFGWGGTVSITGNQGKGTIVKVTLPFNASEEFND